MNELLPKLEPYPDGKHILKVKVPYGKKYVLKPCEIEVKGNTLVWNTSPFAIKDDIKAMAGSKCNFDDNKNFLNWSCTNNYRNRVQIEFLQGKNPLKWFYQNLVQHDLCSDFMNHQSLIADSIATKHYQIIAGDPGVGKTLPVVRNIQHALQNVPKGDYLEKPVWWVGPKSSMDAIEMEFDKWDFKWQLYVKMWSYDQLWRGLSNNRKLLDNPPFFLVCDEIHKLKTAEAKRAVQGCRPVADATRKMFWEKGYVAGLSGSVAPNTPLDYWNVCEIVWPGFLREGSKKALEERLCEMSTSFGFHGHFKKREGWREEEVKKLRLRLKGLVVVVRKQDTNLNLPAKEFVSESVEPSAPLLRAQKALAAAATSAVGLWSDFNMLSNGFQYVYENEGTKTCPTCEGSKVVLEYRDPDDTEREYKTKELLESDLADRLVEAEVECYHCEGSGEVQREVKKTMRVPCPKDDLLRKDLKEEENYNNGRILISDAYTGSIERIIDVCTAEGWEVIRCDGKAFKVIGKPDVKPLKYWMDLENPKVAFVAQPESGGTAFTLIEARKIVFYSNTSKSDNREQIINRLHRPGQKHKVTIKDYFHLPSDKNMLRMVVEKRKLEIMTLSEVVNELFANEKDV